MIVGNRVLCFRFYTKMCERYLVCLREENRCKCEFAAIGEVLAVYGLKIIKIKYGAKWGMPWNLLDVAHVYVVNYRRFMK